MSRVEQIPEDQRAASLRTIATLRSRLGYLADRLSLTFEDGDGDLGRSTGALFRTEAGREFMLLKYLEGPVDDVELLSDEQSSDPGRDLDEFLRAAGLDRSAVTWTVDAPAPTLDAGPRRAS